MVTQKSIKLKDGSTLPAGLPVEFHDETPSICTVYVPGGDKRVRVTSAFPAPSLEELEEATFDGVCESVGGDTVEPDGWDSNHTPSWLLALGMI